MDLQADWKDLTGLEQLRRIMDGRMPPYGRLLGFRLSAVGEGCAEFTAEPGGDHYNPHGVVHGGYTASILDSAMGCAVQTVLPARGSYTTIELKVNFVRAMTSDTGVVKALGTVLHAGRRIATAEGRLVAGDGKLIAHATTTCMLL